MTVTDKIQKRKIYIMKKNDKVKHIIYILRIGIIRYYIYSW